VFSKESRVSKVLNSSDPQYGHFTFSTDRLPVLL
jgi:hypothetical protein